MKDSKIIELLRNEKINSAMKLLYKNWSPIKKFIIKNNGNIEDAEDVFQDAVLILYKKIESGNFELTCNLSTYLFGIVKNLWFAELRKRKVELKSDFDNDIEDKVEFEEDLNYKLSEKAFSLLGKKCQNLLILFYYKKLKMKEIAQKFGFTNDKVAKNEKYRCLEKAKLNYVNLLNNENI